MGKMVTKAIAKDHRTYIILLQCYNLFNISYSTGLFWARYCMFLCVGLFIYTEGKQMLLEILKKYWDSITPTCQEPRGFLMELLRKHKILNQEDIRLAMFVQFYPFPAHKIKYMDKSTVIMNYDALKDKTKLTKDSATIELEDNTFYVPSYQIKELKKGLIKRELKESV